MLIVTQSNHPLGRTIFLDEIVSLEGCYEIAEALMQMDADSHDPITVMINTYGGSVMGMLHLYDVRQNIQSPIVTIVIGKAMSAGLFLSMTLASPGQRLSFPNTKLMAHTVGGFADLTDDSVPNMVYYNDKVLAIMAAIIGIDMPTFKEQVDHNVYLFPEDALAQKWIDRVITPSDAVKLEPSPVVLEEEVKGDDAQPGEGEGNGQERPIFSETDTPVESEGQQPSNLEGDASDTPVTDTQENSDPTQAGSSDEGQADPTSDAGQEGQDVVADETPNEEPVSEEDPETTEEAPAEPEQTEETSDEPPKLDI